MSKKNRPEEELIRMVEAIAESYLTASPDEIEEELAEDGLEAEAVLVRMRNLVRDAVERMQSEDVGIADYNEMMGMKLDVGVLVATHGFCFDRSTGTISVPVENDHVTGHVVIPFSVARMLVRRTEPAE